MGCSLLAMYENHELTRQEGGAALPGHRERNPSIPFCKEKAAVSNKKRERYFFRHSFQIFFQREKLDGQALVTGGRP